MGEHRGHLARTWSDKRVWLRLVLPIVVVWMTSVACGGQDQVLVFAASSLTNVMERLGEEFEAQEGVKVNYNFGASRGLAQQIVRGAPADVFVAAGVQPMDYLDSEGELVQGTRRDLLTNTLALVASKDDGPEIDSLQDLVDGGHRLAIANPELSPAGQYARDALVNLDFWPQLEDRLVFGANVRTVLGYVESGNVAAALVYSTDAAVGDGVRIVAIIPADSHAPIRYPGAVNRESDQRTLAQGFLEYLAGERASAIFTEFGFTPVASP